MLLSTATESDRFLLLATVDREYVLLPKDSNEQQIPQKQIRTFDGRGQSMIVNKTDFPGHFDEEFTIRMWMKHANDEENNEKHHIFCKSDEKCKEVRRFSFLLR